MQCWPLETLSWTTTPGRRSITSPGSRQESCTPRLYSTSSRPETGANRWRSHYKQDAELPPRLRLRRPAHRHAGGRCGAWAVVQASPSQEGQFHLPWLACSSRRRRNCSRRNRRRSRSRSRSRSQSRSRSRSKRRSRSRNSRSHSSKRSRYFDSYSLPSSGSEKAETDQQWLEEGRRKRRCRDCRGQKSEPSNPTPTVEIDETDIRICLTYCAINKYCQQLTLANWRSCHSNLQSAPANIANIEGEIASTVKGLDSHRQSRSPRFVLKEATVLQHTVSGRQRRQKGKEHSFWVSTNMRTQDTGETDILPCRMFLDTKGTRHQTRSVPQSLDSRHEKGNLPLICIEEIEGKGTFLLGVHQHEDTRHRGDRHSSL